MFLTKYMMLIIRLVFCAFINSINCINLQYFKGTRHIDNVKKWARICVGTWLFFHVSELISELMHTNSSLCRELTT